MKTKHFITLDTETTGLPPYNHIFDIGWTVATRKAVKIERSFVVREVITSPRLMLAALNNEDWRSSFGKKIFTFYIPGLADGSLQLTSWRDVVEALRDDMKRFDVDVFTAYNLAFDMAAIKRTNATLRGSRKVLAYSPTLLDLWLFSCQVALRSRLYHDFAKAHDMVSPAGNVRTTAEATYRYLTGQPDFIEAHTALDDAQIETEILQRLLARKKPIPYNDVQHMPWRIAQQIAT